MSDLNEKVGRKVAVDNSIIDELETVCDFVRYCSSEMNRAEVYFGHGTDNAWDDAIALIFHAIDQPIALSNKVKDARLLRSEKLEILSLLDRRITDRIPVPYLTNHAVYADLDFYVDERVLIPRSPIAELITNHFEPWSSLDKVNNILELCTGSGCISVAMAYAFSDALITATDISTDALEVAEHNVELHGVQEQVALLESDVYQNIPTDQKFDVIVSNPPYVSDLEMDTLPEEYLVEPDLALRAEDDGLAIVIDIINGAKDRLTEHGILVVEVGNSEIELVERFPDIPFTWLTFENGGFGVFLLTYEQLQSISID